MIRNGIGNIRNDAARRQLEVAAGVRREELNNQAAQLGQGMMAQAETLPSGILASSPELQQTAMTMANGGPVQRFANGNQVRPFPIQRGILSNRLANLEGSPKSPDVDKTDGGILSAEQAFNRLVNLGGLPRSTAAQLVDMQVGAGNVLPSPVTLPQEPEDFLPTDITNPIVNVDELSFTQKATDPSVTDSAEKVKATNNDDLVGSTVTLDVDEEGQIIRPSSETSVTDKGGPKIITLEPRNQDPIDTMYAPGADPRGQIANPASAIVINKAGGRPPDRTKSILEQATNILANIDNVESDLNGLNKASAKEKKNAFSSLLSTIKNEEVKFKEKDLKSYTKEIDDLLTEAGYDKPKDTSIDGYTTAMIGFLIASGKSPNALQNIIGGLGKGTKLLIEKEKERKKELRERSKTIAGQALKRKAEDGLRRATILNTKLNVLGKQAAETLADERATKKNITSIATALLNQSSRDQTGKNKFILNNLAKSGDPTKYNKAADELGLPNLKLNFDPTNSKSVAEAKVELNRRAYTSPGRGSPIQRATANLIKEFTIGQKEFALYPKALEELIRSMPESYVGERAATLAAARLGTREKNDQG
jgi:hypothetical protein